ncbi:hypothetical protein RISK_000870 [Rhodopirellula islandica]|uniref:Xylose isomerase-like TIM barrel domain-containing protein n=1 Tax=Rhodopirellula islandica TaxID=595434 RepID=A0A0J1ENI1_RHOIS|nr:TIM barrel protein [Rhodopirellula islandica]KLU07069.1 hypothetical protein RISK_000870 [Rhodopirellula islandica]
MSLDRRQFIARSALGLAALSASDVRADKASPKSLRLGLVTYNWGKDWDLPTIIKNCETTQFAGVELRSTHQHQVEITLNSKQREHVRKQFADSNVTLVGLGSACEYHAIDSAELNKNIEETKQFVKLCSDVGGSGVKVRPNGLPAGRPVEKTLEQIGRSLNEVGRFAAEYGVQIRVEVHGKGTTEIAHMKTIMDIADHPNVAVCWNCNPQDLHGEGLAHNYNLLKDRMGTIHIHDLRNNHYPWDELFPMLLDTDAKSFTGWTLIEEGTVPKELLPAMKENRIRWEELTG